MELQFDKIPCHYLKQLISQAQVQEQTQEMRLPDGMPDIGRILGCWGQIMIRSKEWRAGEISVSGGVKVWVLYAPEDATEPRCMDAWIPFQMKWPLPDTLHDGQILLQPYIQGVECRGIGARKMMIRVNVCLHARAFEKAMQDVFQPPEGVENVCIRKRNYPLELPVEAGEKPFAIDEEFTLAPDAPAVNKVVRFDVFPRITEQKVLAGKVIFRGEFDFNLLYICPEGKLHSWKSNGTFSQFSDLDKDYSDAATANMSLIMTLAELDREDNGNLHLKCGMACQYVIFDRMTLEVADDAYGCNRQVKPIVGRLELPVRLDQEHRKIAFSQVMDVQPAGVVDSWVCWAMPMTDLNDDQLDISLQGRCQLLYRNDEGMLQTAWDSLQESWNQPCDTLNLVQLSVVSSVPEVMLDASGIKVCGDLDMQLCIGGSQGIPMLTGLEIGEQIAPDPDRPSVILRRVGADSVWDIAKAYGSTVEKILDANGLSGEPVADRMLLIPIN